MLPDKTAFVHSLGSFLCQQSKGRRVWSQQGDKSANKPCPSTELVHRWAHITFAVEKHLQNELWVWLFRANGMSTKHMKDENVQRSQKVKENKHRNASSTVWWIAINSVSVTRDVHVVTSVKTQQLDVWTSGSIRNVSAHAPLRRSGWSGCAAFLSGMCVRMPEGN